MLRVLASLVAGKGSGSATKKATPHCRGLRGFFDDGYEIFVAPDRGWPIGAVREVISVS